MKKTLKKFALVSIIAMLSSSMFASEMKKGVVHISEYSDSNAGVQPDTFPMRFSRL